MAILNNRNAKAGLFPKVGETLLLLSVFLRLNRIAQEPVTLVYHLCQGVVGEASQFLVVKGQKAVMEGIVGKAVHDCVFHLYGFPGKLQEEALALCEYRTELRSLR